MRLRILILVLIATAFAEEKHAQRSSRASRGQIRYSNNDGAKVNWKFFTPETEYQQPQTANAQYEHAQRSQRAEGNDAPVQRAPPRQSAPQPVQLTEAEPNQQQYRPYSDVPASIKQLIFQTYGPQRPHVDPTAFFYSSQFAGSPQYEQQPAAAESSDSRYEQPSGYENLGPKYQTRRAYSERRSESQGKIQYVRDDEQSQQEQDGEYTGHIAVPVETMPLPPPPKIYIDKNMPSEIQRLLQYQAQIPYDVVANKIFYKPKKLFIPKPLSDDIKGPYYYRSKIYYMKNDEIVPDYESSKPVEEEESH